MDITYKLINKDEPLKSGEKEAIIEFLFHHLDEFGDSREAIGKCLDYAQQKNNRPGGTITLALDGDEIIGAVVTNETGMEGYIPENILVYIAMHSGYRGKGIGKEIMKRAMNAVTGDIALHVEPENPAVHLYRKLGFTSKYLEMRMHR
jgi:[ribosomal protein S18]-alanine N-acetyltransferase